MIARIAIKRAAGAAELEQTGRGRPAPAIRPAHNVDRRGAFIQRSFPASMTSPITMRRQTR